MKTNSLRIKEAAPVPVELMKKLSKVRHQLSIGIPKENCELEKRVALTPEAVDMIVDAGHKVFLEEGAGFGINYSNNRYSEAGAKITSDRAVVFQSDLVFKISAPTKEDILMMKDKATIASMLQLTDISLETIKSMSAKKINAVGYELIAEGSECYPVRNAISEIEGAASISLASELLSNSHGGKGVLMGGAPGVSPIEIMIIGAGVGGTVAAKVALALGATVKVFDNSINKLRKLQNAIGIDVFTSVFQPNVLVNAFKTVDVVIGAMRYIDSSVRYVISEEMIHSMKKGALIIDLRVNQGGCFETSCFLSKDHPPVFEKFGILHYCIPNLSSRVARTTSMALSNIFTPIVVQLGDLGDILRTTGFSSGLYMYGGNLVNAYVAKHFNLPSNDIGLFLSVY